MSNRSTSVPVAAFAAPPRMIPLVEQSTQTPLEDDTGYAMGMTGSMAVIEALPTPVLPAPRDWTVLHVNAAWEALTGWKRSEVLSTRLHNWVQPVDGVRLQQLTKPAGGAESKLGSRWDLGLRLKGGWVGVGGFGDSVEIR